MTIENVDRSVKGGTIVVGVDGSGGAEEALTWAVALATDEDAEILAIHTVEPPVFMDPYPFLSGAIVEPGWSVAWKEWIQAAQEEMEAWCATRIPEVVSWRLQTIEGGVQALVERADQAYAGLIVVGRRGRSGLAEVVLGSYSHRLVHHTDLPVVIVPGHRSLRAA